MSNQNAAEIQEWMINWIAKEAKIKPEQVNIEEPFVNFGLGSRQAVMLAADLEDWLQREFPPSLAWDYPTIEKLAEYLSQEEVKNGSAS